VVSAMKPPDAAPSIVRPFLKQGVERTRDTGAGSQTVRAYVMTGGRASSRIKLDFQSILSVIPAALQVSNNLTFERAKVVELCRTEALSVAELSVRLAVPLGVIQILGGDLVEEGFLQAFTTDRHITNDIALLERLVRGIRAL
jgi:Protein of unknown function (DUF742)